MPALFLNTENTVNAALCNLWFVSKLVILEALWNRTLICFQLTTYLSSWVCKKNLSKRTGMLNLILHNRIVVFIKFGIPYHLSS